MIFYIRGRNAKLFFHGNRNRWIEPSHCTTRSYEKNQMCFKIFGKVQVRNQMFLNRMKLNYGLYYRDEGKKSNVA